MDSNRRALDECAPFAQLNTDLVDHVFASMHEVQFGDGDYVIREGDEGECLYIVASGKACAFVQEQRLASFKRGDIVGEMALVTQEARNADVVADGSLTVLALPVDDFNRLAGRYPQLGMVVTHLVAERLGQHSLDGLGGKVLSGYRIEGSVGRGAMAVVYRARHAESGRTVALKMMSHRLLYEPGALTRFEREAEIVEQLEHPNIARLYERFSAYKTSFMVMEFCDGAVLDEYLAERGPFSEEVTRRILGQLASALNHIHVRGIIHRDLKPSNTMVSSDGIVKVMDFGLAKGGLKMSKESLTQSNSLLGTPLYMSPEQIAGEKIDARADIYALACIGYELLTGASLFNASNFFELVRQKSMQRLPPRAEIGAGISDELHRVLDLGLRQHADERDVDLAVVEEWAAPL